MRTKIERTSQGYNRAKVKVGKMKEKRLKTIGKTKKQMRINLEQM